MENALFDMIIGSGGLGVVAALLFWVYSRERARADALTDRYIAHLEQDEVERELADEMERPTRPVRPPKLADRLVRK